MMPMRMRLGDRETESIIEVTAATTMRATIDTSQTRRRSTETRRSDTAMRTRSDTAMRSDTMREKDTQRSPTDTTESKTL